MLAFFIIRLVIALAISVFLFFLVLKYFKLFSKEKCKTPSQVYLPCIVSLAFVLYILVVTAPKALDSLAIYRNTISYKQVELSSEPSIIGTVKTTDGEKYHISPWSKKISLGEKYIISYTPRDKCILSVEKTAGQNNQDNSQSRK